MKVGPVSKTCFSPKVEILEEEADGERHWAGVSFIPTQRGKHSEHH